MRSFSRLIIPLFIFLLAGVISLSEKVVVFLYHRFDDARYPSTNTYTEELKNHVRFVRERDYEIWTLKDLKDYLDGKRTLTGTAVLFTVDDGYLTTYTKAFPVFKSLGVPFSVFLYIEGISKYPDYITWDMAREMKEWGVEFGLHSYSHESFPSLLEEMDEEGLKKHFIEDTLKARNIFEKELGEKPLYYAYPYGHYTTVMREALEELGFSLAFTQDVGPLKKGFDRFMLPREPLLQDWASLEHLEYVFNREPLLLERFEPVDRAIKKGSQVSVSTIVSSSNTVRFLRAQVYATGVGWMEAELEGRKISHKELLVVTADQTRFGVRVQGEDGRWYYRFWYVPVLKSE